MIIIIADWRSSENLQPIQNLGNHSRPSLCAMHCRNTDTMLNLADLILYILLSKERGLYNAYRQTRKHPATNRLQRCQIVTCSFSTYPSSKNLHRPTSSKSVNGSNHARCQTARKHILDFYLCLPPCAVTRHQHMRLQSFEVLNSPLNECFIRANQVIASNDSMQWCSFTSELQRVLRSIDDAGVTAACENNSPLP